MQIRPHLYITHTRTAEEQDHLKSLQHGEAAISNQVNNQSTPCCDQTFFTLGYSWFIFGTKDRPNQNFECFCW